MLVTLIISDVIYVIGGYSKGDILNTLQSYDMTTQKWTTLPPMKEKREDWLSVVETAGHRAILIWGDRDMAGGCS